MSLTQTAKMVYPFVILKILSLYYKIKKMDEEESKSHSEYSDTYNEDEMDNLEDGEEMNGEWYQSPFRIPDPYKKHPQSSPNN